MKTCGQALIEMLQSHGIDHVFGIPGVHTIELYRGLVGSGIRHVTPRHEQGAGFMADGFARASGRPACCFIITGPGMTNITTAMGQAYGDSIPMLVISGVNRRHELGMGQGRLHEISDQRGLVKHVAGFSHTLLRPSDLPAVMERAFALMSAQRPRPVHIEIPIDVFGLNDDDMDVAAAGVPSRTVPDPAAVEEVARLLNTSKRPVLVIGGGAVAAGDCVTQLAERLDAPTTLTSNAKGLLQADHPLLLGSYMSCSEVAACVRDADVVLAIGTELGETDYGFDGDPTFETSGTLIRVDIESEQTTRNALPALALTADATLAIEALLGVLGADAAKKEGAARVKAAHAAGTMHELEPRFTRHHEVLQAVRAALPDAIIVGDSTEPVYFGQSHFATDKPRSWFCSSTGYGTLGYALPAAIGAKLGAPERPVVALTGDGGLMYTVAEMAAAVEAKTPIICLLWNNQAFQEIKHHMVAAQVPPVGVELHAPNFIMLAESMGWAAQRAATLDALPNLLAEAGDSEGPTLIEYTPATFGMPT